MVIPSSIVSSRTHSLVSSVRFSPLLELDGPGASLVSTGSPCMSSSSSCSPVGSSFASSAVSGGSGGRARGSAGGISAIVVFGLCGVSTTARRFSCDQLCSASRQTLSSVLTRCSSVRSLRPALARLLLEKFKEKRMPKTLTSLLSSRAKNENDSSQLLSIKTLQKAENHRIIQYLHSWKPHCKFCHAFPQKSAPEGHSCLPQQRLRDTATTVRCKRRPGPAVSATSITPPCSKNPLGNPFRKDTFVLRPWRIDSPLLHSFPMRPTSPPRLSLPEIEAHPQSARRSAVALGSRWEMRRPRPKRQ